MNENTKPATRGDFTAGSKGATFAGVVDLDERSARAAQLSVADLLPSRSNSGLRPRDVPKAWLQGLNDAGVSAKIAKHHQGGGKYRTLPLVIQVPCPSDHVDETGESWARVLLKINPYSGWVSIHEDSCCRCPREAIERWLITCPRCMAGDDHPDHDEAMFYLPDGDESPISYVIEAMAQFQAGADLVKDMRSPPARLTASEAVMWLDSHITESGDQLVPPTLGQAATWEAVKHLPGCPTQSLIREAQAARKTRV